MEIITDNTMDAWKKALTNIIKLGRDFKDTDKRICRELTDLNLTILHPENDIQTPINVISRLKKWNYPDIDKLESVIISRKGSSSYDYTYGERIFNFDEKDQINDFLRQLLEDDPTSRRGYINLWNPKEDSNIENKNVPGLVGIYFRKKENLDMTAFIRSNDLFIGWPANIYQLFTLQRFIAKQLGFKTGKLTTFSTSAHLFEEHFEDIRKVIKK